jgi:diguanylate cyclase (GGDEF)-like protein
VKEYLDNLTGLNNMLYLLENYNQYISSNDNTYTIAIDFRHLKYINDNFGHAVGDSCITIFSDLVKSYFKNSLLARRSGDEFIIITNHEPEIIEEKIKNIHNNIIDYYNKGEIPVAFQFNCGIKKCDSDLKETIYKADITMYHAKKNEKMFEYYNHRFLTSVENREKFIKYLDDLIETDSFKYQIQYVYDIKGENKIIGEIFTRDKEGQSIFDAGKYEILKTNYRLKKIDIVNINKIFGKIVPILGNEQKISLNIHYQTILSYEYNFIEHLKRKIEKYNINPANICLNINTIEYSDTIKRLIENLLELKKIGIEICVENFNVSEKQYVIPIISAVNIDYVTINRQMLVKAMNEKRIKLVLQHVVLLLLSLKIKPIFINVETENERDFIEQLDGRCLIRGYVFSKEINIEKS